jgi:hypothetical protein
MRNEDDDDAFQHDWQKFSGMDNEKFDDYILWTVTWQPAVLIRWKNCARAMWEPHC